MTLAPDGFKNLDGKVFNEKFPGPWIQIKVKNYLQFNGTSIHWHGVRMLNTFEQDGVNVSNENRGPMTFYGPSSANYDESLDPILITDWSHRSAFTDFYRELGVNGSGRPLMTSILLNDAGRYKCTGPEIEKGNCTTAPPLFTKVIETGKKYLLRLINTSVDTTFVFAVDNHNLTVIGMDFVPIVPYTARGVLVGIGQRYHVILEAKPQDDRAPADQNYWMRTIIANGCSGFNTSAPNPPEENGILRYAKAAKENPTTKKTPMDESCADEPYDKLVPVVKWTVGEPVNEPAEQGGTFQVGMTEVDPVDKKYPGHGNFSRWDMGQTPMFLNFSDPTINSLGQNRQWPPEYGVIGQSGATVKEDSWIYLVITATSFPFGAPRRTFIPAAHPIHLHGHDFAILAQSEKPYWDPLVKLKKDNPPRRDVALLPANGYLIIAFQADNPGSWLMHCHIAWHASSGLALQILERESEIKYTIQGKNETERICKNWNTWYDNKANHWSPVEFQDDSGI
ncbi:Laccase [Lachnellula suecica]|uniref:Laccase n=1 Tax=Lachnellula suecica TaxID=602035 RepID=A0A8T9CAA9_9HELO|nr:Laccase [Lachnellula suecica]